MSKKRSRHWVGTQLGTRPANGLRTVAGEPLLPDVGLLKVVLRFVVVYAILLTAAWFLEFRGYFGAVVDATAKVTGAASNLTGVPATVSGNEVFLASRVLRIDLDCTGISLMLIYAALVLAYPLSAKRRLLGLVVGLPVLLVANLIRLTAVAQLSNPLGDKTFELVHDYLFQVVMMGVAIALWALYLASARRHAS